MLKSAADPADKLFAATTLKGKVLLPNISNDSRMILD